MSYEVFLWDKEGNLIEHDCYDYTSKLLQDYPYELELMDISDNGKWVTHPEIKERYSA